MSAHMARTWLRRWRLRVLLAALICWYGLATLPYLSDFPLVTFDEAGIAAPAYKLATQGVYGNDLYTGYYQSEMYTYEYMPLYPLLVAASFKIFGMGVEQQRLVTVLCGLAVVLLTFALGRQLYDAPTGVAAAAALCCIRLSADPRASGVLLLDLARIARYDMLVAACVVATCCCFYWALSNQIRWGYAATGFLAGLATLSHPNGAFILFVVAGALLWHHGLRALRCAPIYLIAAGWLIACLPWAIYILWNPTAYYGQMLRHTGLGRFELLAPSFYWNNLVAEHNRYSRIFPAGGQLLAPLVGVWLTLMGVLVANISLWLRVRRLKGLADRLLLLTLPVPAGLLALLVDHKYYGYLTLILPFIAIQTAWAIIAAWRRLGSRAKPGRLILGALLAAALLEGGIGVAHGLAIARSTSPYLPLTGAIAQAIPPGSRILMTHHYWYGLAQYETRSVLLPIYLSSPRYYQPQPLSIEEALDLIAPDYLIADWLVEPEVRVPPGPNAEAQKLDFARYMRRHCAGVVLRLDDADYGPITLYRCDMPGEMTR
jgi:4-amino-4-deoxy-L-arabinose transferase-like glycosyltransferase